MWPETNLNFYKHKKPAWLICVDFPLAHFHVSFYNIHFKSFLINVVSHINFLCILFSVADTLSCHLIPFSWSTFISIVVIALPSFICSRALNKITVHTQYHFHFYQFWSCSRALASSTAFCVAIDAEAALWATWFRFPSPCIMTTLHAAAAAVMAASHTWVITDFVSHEHK